MTCSFLHYSEIVNPSHSKAVQEIYDSVGQSFEGRAITLANHTQERTGNWFILFSVPILTVTADVVEFYQTPSSVSNKYKIDCLINPAVLSFVLPLYHSL